MTAGQDITIAVITHGDGGVFWSVFQKGAEKAGKDLGITVKYKGSNNTGTKQAATINQSVADGVDGLAVSLADPDAVRRTPCKAAVDAGIPVVTTNSGSDLYKEFGAFTHIGQDEFTAGAGAGEKFKQPACKASCAPSRSRPTPVSTHAATARRAPSRARTTQITTSGDDSGKQQADIKAKLDC